MQNSEYEDLKEKLIYDYCYTELSVMDIVEKYNCSRSKMLRKMREWGYSKRPVRIQRKERYNAKYHVDSHFFDEIKTEHQAYWLGFMLADGFVNERCIMFCFQRRDIDSIEQFRSDLKSNHPITYNKDGNPLLAVVSKTLCKALIDKGFHNRKSWGIDIDKIISYVPNNLINHFIRGMFDGDGCIKYYKYDYVKSPQYHFGYTGLLNVCTFIKNSLNLTRRPILENNQTYTIITRDPVKINYIYDYLYNNATIYMSRKKLIFEEIKMMTFNDYNKAISLQR